MQVIAVGDVFVDCLMSGLPRLPQLGEEVYGRNFALAVGGDPALYALNLARLDLETTVVARLGVDFFSDFISGAMPSKSPIPKDEWSYSRFRPAPSDWRFK